MGYEKIIKKGSKGIDVKKFKKMDPSNWVPQYEKQFKNPAEGRDAFKARERGWMKRQIEEEKMSRLKDNERNARSFEYKRPELTPLGKRLMEESKNQERAEMSGGELKSMVQNKEAEKRDRTPGSKYWK